MRECTDNSIFYYVQKQSFWLLFSKKIKLETKSDNNLHLKKINVLIKSAFNKNYNHCYYQLFLENCSQKKGLI